MKRKMLAFLLVLTFVVSIAEVSLADFDYSLFQNNDNFIVKVDPFDDSVQIDMIENFIPIEDRGLTHTSLIQNQGIQTILITTLVIGIHNFKEIIFLPDTIRYTIGVRTGVVSKSEAVAFVLTPSLMPMFDEILEKQITSVKYRLVGDSNFEGTFKINLEQLKILIDLYKEAGGITQVDMDMVDNLFPVVIK